MRPALLALVWLLTVAAAPIALITDISQRRIDIVYTFKGAELLVFGAIQYPRGRVPDAPPGLAIVVRGPAEPVTIRRKGRVAGVWLNTEAVRFETAPGFYKVVTSRPIPELVDERTAAIYELGVANLQLSPVSDLPQEEARAFEAGLIDLRRKAGLYGEQPEAVQVTRNVLYSARIAIPAAVPVGDYAAEIFLIRDGAVIARATSPISIEKSGFERWVFVAAQNQPLFYGLAAVWAAVAAGWLAGLIVRR